MEAKETNHRNGSYPRSITLKKIGEVEVTVPRDRQGKYQTKVLPKSKQYEDEIRQDIAMMFLGGISFAGWKILRRKTRFLPNQIQ